MEKKKRIFANDTEKIAGTDKKTARPERLPERRELPEDVVVGRNAVTEALKSGRTVNRLLVAEHDTQGSIREIVNLARESGAVVETVPRSQIEAAARGFRHQGVLAYTSPVE